MEYQASLVYIEHSGPGLHSDTLSQKRKKKIGTMSGSPSVHEVLFPSLTILHPFSNSIKINEKQFKIGQRMEVSLLVHSTLQFFTYSLGWKLWPQHSTAMERGLSICTFTSQIPLSSPQLSQQSELVVLRPYYAKAVVLCTQTHVCNVYRETEGVSK